MPQATINSGDREKQVHDHSKRGRTPVEDATVLIVGAGPAGITAAMLLAQRGPILKRRSSRTHWPLAHLLNQRTMEAFHDIGVSDGVYQMPPPDDHWQRVSWRTPLGGEGPLKGLEIGHLPALGVDYDAPRYAAGSPRAFANVSADATGPHCCRGMCRKRALGVFGTIMKSGTSCRTRAVFS